MAAAPSTIGYPCELTLFLRMLTDFSGWTVRCENKPGGACFEEKCNYVAILFIFISFYTTTIFICITATIL